MMEIPVTFRSERQPVAGVLHLPARRRPRVPAVLFLHGFTGTRVEFRRSFVRLARALAQTSVAGLRFDFRGSGESAGDFSTLTPSSELADARAALRFLQRQVCRLVQNRIYKSGAVLMVFIVNVVHAV